MRKMVLGLARAIKRTTNLKISEHCKNKSEDNFLEIENSQVATTLKLLNVF